MQAPDIIDAQFEVVQPGSDVRAYRGRPTAEPESGDGYISWGQLWFWVLTARYAKLRQVRFSHPLIESWQRVMAVKPDPETRRRELRSFWRRLAVLAVLPVCATFLIAGLLFVAISFHLID